MDDLDILFAILMASVAMGIVADEDLSTDELDELWAEVQARLAPRCQTMQ